MTRTPSRLAHRLEEWGRILPVLEGALRLVLATISALGGLAIVFLGVVLGSPASAGLAALLLLFAARLLTWSR